MRVVIAEDEALLREGLVLLLEGTGITVAATTATATETETLVDRERPELLITDIRMPPGYGEDGLQAAIAVRSRFPDTAVIVLSQHVNRQYAEELLGERPHGVGYLLKQRVADSSAFRDAIGAVTSGGTVLDPEVVALMMSRARRKTDDLDRLTPRQAEILALLAQGLTNVAVARRLGVTEKSVVHQVSRIYEALGLPPTEEDHRRVLAVLRYLSREDD